MSAEAIGHGCDAPDLDNPCDPPSRRDGAVRPADQDDASRARADSCAGRPALPSLAEHVVPDRNRQTIIDRHHPTQAPVLGLGYSTAPVRSEEHTSELQSPCNLVCRLLLEKNK